MKTLRLLIERFESRDVPGVLNLVDVDGDLVTVATTKGNDAQLASAVVRIPAGVPGGQKIFQINLFANAVFDTADLTVTAKPGPLGGDGLVNVGDINAAGLDLGTVTIDGGMTGPVSAGKNTPESTVKAINAHFVSGLTIWTINASVGSIRVGGDLAVAEIHINGPQGLGALRVGGSLIGNSVQKTGYVTVPNGKIGSVRIGGDILGGTGQDSGEVTAKSLGNVSIGGSIRGATVDPGGNHTRTGLLESLGTTGSVRIGGSLVGGALGSSGEISSSDSLASLSIGGSLIGGPQLDSAFVNVGGNILGKVTIGGSLVGGAGQDSGKISTSGAISGSVVIGGDLVGGAGQFGGELHAIGSVDSVTVRGSIYGGGAFESGTLHFSGNVGSLTVRGDLIGGTPSRTGSLLLAGDVGKIRVGSSVFGGPNVLAGGIFVAGSAGVISIGKNLVGTAAFPAEIEARGNQATTGPSVAIRSLTIGGRVEFGRILAGYDWDALENPDAQIRSVKVGGDWIASNLVSGVSPGIDSLYGTSDDGPIPQLGEPDAYFSKIGSITIRGKVEGTISGGDHFGFVAQEIGAFNVNGIAFKLKAGHSNDTSVLDTHLMVGATGDVTIHEV